MRVGEACERAPPLLGPLLHPFPWSGGQPYVLGSGHQPREALPVLGWGGDLGSAVLGTGVGCEGGVLLSASICPRPHQLRALGSELEIALLGVTRRTAKGTCLALFLVPRPVECFWQPDA
jgi:hypothetical protein